MKPLVNIYTPEILRDYGYRGVTIEKAAADAWARGKRGRVIYNFERSELCEKLLAIWREALHNKAIDTITKASVVEMPVTMNFTPEQITVLGAQFFSNRKWLVETAWRNTPPMIPYDVHTEVTTEGTSTVIIGSMKLVSLSASRDLREKLRPQLESIMKKITLTEITSRKKPSPNGGRIIRRIRNHSARKRT